MIEYWHWHTLHFGTETYWGGILPHSQKPGRAYRELAQLGADFAAAGAAVRRGTPDADIAVLYDSDSKFALASQAPFGAPGAYMDPDAYRKILASFVRGAFDAGLQTRLVRPQQVFPTRATPGVDAIDGGDPAAFAARYPILLIPAFFTAADEELDWLDAYAAAGGHLVLGPRSAYADREGRARLEVQPARLADAAGTWYDEFANLPEADPGHGADASGDFHADGRRRTPPTGSTGSPSTTPIGATALAPLPASAPRPLAGDHHPRRAAPAASPSSVPCPTMRSRSRSPNGSFRNPSPAGPNCPPR